MIVRYEFTITVPNKDVWGNGSSRKGLLPNLQLLIQAETVHSGLLQRFPVQYRLRLRLFEMQMSPVETSPYAAIARRPLEICAVM